MLRIQRRQVDEHRMNLILQGRIVAAWANLLEREFLELGRSGFRVVLDVEGVFFIGRSGLEVLYRLGRAGVRIVGCSPLFAPMLEQVGIAVTRKDTMSMERSES